MFDLKFMGKKSFYSIVYYDKQIKPKATEVLTYKQYLLKNKHEVKADS